MDFPQECAEREDISSLTFQEWSSAVRMEDGFRWKVLDVCLAITPHVALILALSQIGKLAALIEMSQRSPSQSSYYEFAEIAKVVDHNVVRLQITMSQSTTVEEVQGK